MASLTFLGTGTSDGIPMVGCSCPICCSDDPRNNRLRSSVLIKTQSETILIDCGPDFREQALAHQIKELSFILLTHHHSDHVSGLAELRPLSRVKPIDIYLSENTKKVVLSSFSYFFTGKRSGGGLPKVNLHGLNEIPKTNEVWIEEVPIMHGTDLISGFRIGNLAYITDASEIPDESFEKLKGIDFLVVNALREKPHATHFSIEEACQAARRTTAKQVWLTHLCHQIDHSLYSSRLPSNISIAQDGLVIEFDPSASSLIDNQ